MPYDSQLIQELSDSYREGLWVWFWTLQTKWHLSLAPIVHVDLHQVQFWPLGIKHKRAAYGRVRGAGAGLAAASGCCQTLRFAAFVPRGEVGKLLPRLSSCPASGPRAGAPQSGSSPAPGLPVGGDGRSEGTETQQRNTWRVKTQ